ncbi:MAG: PQQ-binding-like beta-propeller repeat protein, partial [Bdellovibrionaceae bacterium]|nr:PQQ-binding-like beta-propeller repeat protein [Pseudobdellovibrionaceae bacterium]
TGRQVWLYSRPEGSSFSIRGAGRPALFENRVIVGFNDGFMVALDAHSGKQIWETELSKKGRFRDLDSDLVVHEGVLYFGSVNGPVGGLDPKTGEVLWELPHNMSGGFAFSQNVFAFGDLGGHLWELDKKQRTPTLELKSQRGLISTPVYLGNRYLLYGESQGDFVIYDRIARREWGRYATGRGLGGGAPKVFIQNDKVWIYVVSNEGYLYAFLRDWNQQEEVLY